MLFFFWIIQQVNMSNNTTHCPNISTYEFNIFAVCTYSFISIVGLIFNLMALAFFFRHTKSRSQTIVYMTNLAIADTLLILTLPMRIYHHLGFTGLPQWLCDALGLVLKANMYGSIFLLTCICFDRCMAVSFPMAERVQKGRQKAPLICLGVWLFTFGASLPIYFSKLKENSNVTCYTCFESQPVYSTQPVVVSVTLFVGFGIPFVIMLICSWGLLRAVQQSTVAQTSLVDSRKIQRMVAASLLIFLLSFLPYHATLLFLCLHKNNISSSMLTAYQYSLIAACLNTVLDPIAYYFTTETFRRNVDMSAVRRMFLLNSQSSEMGNRSRVPNSS